MQLRLKLEYGDIAEVASLGRRYNRQERCTHAACNRQTFSPFQSPSHRLRLDPQAPPLHPGTALTHILSNKLAKPCPRADCPSLVVRS